MKDIMNLKHLIHGGNIDDELKKRLNNIPSANLPFDMNNFEKRLNNLNNNNIDINDLEKRLFDLGPKISKDDEDYLMNKDRINKKLEEEGLKNLDSLEKRFNNIKNNNNNNKIPLQLDSLDNYEKRINNINETARETSNIINSILIETINNNYKNINSFNYGIKEYLKKEKTNDDSIKYFFDKYSSLLTNIYYIYLIKKNLINYTNNDITLLIKYYQKYKNDINLYLSSNTILLYIYDSNNKEIEINNKYIDLVYNFKISNKLNNYLTSYYWTYENNIVDNKGQEILYILLCIKDLLQLSSLNELNIMFNTFNSEIAIYEKILDNYDNLYFNFSNNKINDNNINNLDELQYSEYIKYKKYHEIINYIKKNIYSTNNDLYNYILNKYNITNSEIKNLVNLVKIKKFINNDNNDIISSLKSLSNYINDVSNILYLYDNNYNYNSKITNVNTKNSDPYSKQYTKNSDPYSKPYSNQYSNQYTKNSDPYSKPYSNQNNKQYKYLNTNTNTNTNIDYIPIYTNITNNNITNNNIDGSFIKYCNGILKQINNVDYNYLNYKTKDETIDNYLYRLKKRYDIKIV